MMNNGTQFSFQKFAGEGLRTLCLAVKDLDEAYFEVSLILNYE